MFKLNWQNCWHWTGGGKRGCRSIDPFFFNQSPSRPWTCFRASSSAFQAFDCYSHRYFWRMFRRGSRSPIYRTVAQQWGSRWAPRGHQYKAPATDLDRETDLDQYQDRETEPDQGRERLGRNRRRWRNCIRRTWHLCHRRQSMRYWGSLLPQQSTSYSCSQHRH